MAQAQGVYSTHDWTAGATQEQQYREVWADVKTPGDGFHYSVGTIQVDSTGTGALFSGMPASRVSDPTNPLFPPPVGPRKQVVMVQCTRAVPKAANPATFQEIVWQKYFYGAFVNLDPSDRATNARGIAVWPTGDPTTTRIAICGETYDERLPGSAESFLLASSLAPTGFVAVLDGDGTLLWTRHFFGSDSAHSCAITDVSIRVEPDERETVTYCGISSNGDPGPGTNLTLDLQPTTVLAGLPGEWDGVVGRVSRLGALVDSEFHCNVDLVSERNGFFGLAEIEVDYAPPIKDRFVAVGSLAFPGTSATNNSGFAMVFDAVPTRSMNNLIIESPAIFGANESNTIARDVVVLRDGFLESPGTTRHLLAVVGSTDDAGMLPFPTSPPPAPPVWPAVPVVHAGGTDGFVVMISDRPVSVPFGGLTLLGGQFFGGPGDDGFTGVQGWNEYPDSFIAAGFTQGPTGGTNQDIGVVSYFLDSSVANVSPTSIRVVRQDQFGGATAPAIGGSNIERPAGMGVVNATTVGLAFPTFGLDDPAGGGVAVDQLARVNVVGFTEATDYFWSPVPPTADLGRPRDPASPADAVRTVYDMLPPQRASQTFGTGRTDLSGSQATWVLPTGMTGGSSPVCALSQFGRRIGDPAPVMSRIFVDYEGDAPQAGVTNGALLISRPPNNVFTAWQWDIAPSGSGIPAFTVFVPPTANGVEVFVPDAILTGAIGFAGVGLPGNSIRVPVLFPATPPPPLLGMSMVGQVLSWSPTGVPGGLTCGPTDTTEIVGSAGIWLPLL